MLALYDQKGEVGIWLGEDQKWLLDLQGNAIACVHEGSMYDLRGRHVAWWKGDRIEDHAGNVIFVTHDVEHLRMLKPFFHLRPLPPIPKIMPVRPLLSLRPIEFPASGRWGDPRVFLDCLRCHACS